MIVISKMSPIFERFYNECQSIDFDSRSNRRYTLTLIA